MKKASVQVKKRVAAELYDSGIIMLREWLAYWLIHSKHNMQSFKMGDLMSIGSESKTPLHNNN